MFSAPTNDPVPAARAALDRARLIVNRTPYLTPQSRREANRAIDTLVRQFEMNRMSPRNAAKALELLNRAHPSTVFGLLRDDSFSAIFAPALRELGLRPIRDRLDEVASTTMAAPVRGPAAGRRHRDELPPTDRVDAEGNALPPPPGFY